MKQTSDSQKPYRPAIGKYAINFMWVNKKLEPSRKYICNKEYLEDFLKSIIDWKKSNPEAILNIWYDSVHTTNESIENTKGKIKEQLQEISGHTEELDINFRDLRDITVVRENPDVFSEQMPLYFRIDLLKLIIVTHTVESDSNEYSIYLDKGAAPMNKYQLFDDESIEKLQKMGMLINRESSGGRENQFLQLKNNPQFIQSLKDIVNISLLRGAFALNLPEGRAKTQYMKPIYYSVYYNTIETVYLHYIASKLGKILIGDSDKMVEYDRNKHGYSCFGNITLSGGRTPATLKGSLEENKLYDVDVEYYDQKGNEMLRFDAKSHTRRIPIRPGGDHEDKYTKTLPPADGTDEYKCKFWVTKKLIKDEQLDQDSEQEVSKKVNKP